MIAKAGKGRGRRDIVCESAKVVEQKKDLVCRKKTSLALFRNKGMWTE
jgi:hypothetical protein